MFTRAAILTSLLCCAGVAQADDLNVISMDRKGFAAYESQVFKDLQEGRKYEEISAQDLKTVQQKFATMDALWQKADSAGNLVPPDLNALEADLADVGIILHRAFMASRPICDYEVPTGSLISKKVCRSPAQIRHEQQEAKGEMKDFRTPHN